MDPDTAHRSLARTGGSPGLDAGRNIGLCSLRALCGVAVVLSLLACGRAQPPVVSSTEAVFAAPLMQPAPQVQRVQQAQAQTNPGPRPSEAELLFMHESANAALFQIESARLAERRTQAPAVKAYASLVAMQQEAALDGLHSLFVMHGLPLPGGIVPARRSVLDALAALAPEVFDARYVQQVGVAENATDIARIDLALRGMPDTALKMWAGRTQKMLQDHLAAARQLPVPVQTLAPAKRWFLVNVVPPPCTAPCSNPV